MTTTRIPVGESEASQRALRAAGEAHLWPGQLSYAPDGTVSPATIRLADRIAGLAPDPDSRVFFVSGGSEAVETAIKTARKYHRNNGEPGRFKLISRRGSYHGCTLGCLSLGGGGSNTGVEYPPQLSAYAFEPPLVTQLPKEVAGSDTEATAFVTGTAPER